MPLSTATVQRKLRIEITGPTASGKTLLAVNIVELLKTIFAIKEEEICVLEENEKCMTVDPIAARVIIVTRQSR